MKHVWRGSRTEMTIKTQCNGRVLDREVNSKTIILGYSRQVNALNMTYGTTSVLKKRCNSRQNHKQEGIRRTIFHGQRTLHQYKGTARKSKENQKVRTQEEKNNKVLISSPFLMATRLHIPNPVTSTSLEPPCILHLPPPTPASPSH